jgi:centrosome and spindle pole-associated protein 1
LIAERRLQVQNSPRQYQQQAPQPLPPPSYDPGYDLYRTRSANSLENLSRPLDPPISSAIDPSLADILRRPPVGAKTPLPPPPPTVPRVQFSDNVRYNEYPPNPRSVPNLPIQQFHTAPTTTFGTSRQAAADNGFNFTEDQNKDLKSMKAKEYQEELQRQVREKQMQKQREKEEKERTDKKMLMETMNYNPFGRSGGGAPIKDKDGNVVADLSQVKSDSARFSPREIVPPQNQFNFPNPKGSNEMLNLLFKSPQSPTTQQSFFGGALNSATNNNNNNNDQTFARGGNGIFGEGKSDEKKKQEEKYKSELQQQVFTLRFSLH